jgi:hypothetical protein
MINDVFAFEGRNPSVCECLIFHAREITYACYCFGHLVISFIPPVTVATHVDQQDDRYGSLADLGHGV